VSDNKRPVSPVNGQPLPRGKQFTSETAREARAKRATIEAERKSIAQAFKKTMLDEHELKDPKSGVTVRKTGAEIVADSIVRACQKGNANAMNIALALMGEKPAENLNVITKDFAALDEAFEGLKLVGK
jgi:hypothetical protein